MDQTEFINKAISIHGNEKYDFSKVNYKNCHIKITIICKFHGEFEQLPASFLRKKHHISCVKCTGVKTFTKEDFIKIAQGIHGNKYDYTLVDYKNNKTKIKIICNVHGVFEQLPSSHIRNQPNKVSGCSKCKYEKRKSTTQKFIEKAKNIHGDQYDYSKSKYTSHHNKLEIICSKKFHGSFWQTPHSHVIGKSGCPNCNNSKGEAAINRFLTKNKIEFISQKKFENCINPTTKHRLKFDFYLLKINVCIEYDGWQHSKPIKLFGGIQAFKDLKQRDKIKNNFCKKHNIKLIRINPNDNIEEKLKHLL